MPGIRLTIGRRWSLLLLLAMAAAAVVVLLGLGNRSQAFRGRGVMPAGLPARASAGGREPRRVVSSPRQWMTLDPSGQYLINSFTNQPVFLTGDDAFSLIVQLRDEDIQLYLADRAARGFNAIWVGLTDNTYTDHPPFDPYGNAPFNGADFTNPNPVYWARVDRVLGWAEAKGITVFASPAFVGYGCKGGLCESYRKSSRETLTAYGQFLGSRYKGLSNIVWLIGGDANPQDQDVQVKLNDLALGIKSADMAHLMTAEGYRGISAEGVWPNASWLDLEALYLKPEDISPGATAAYQTAVHPILMFEDWYEGEHSMSELDVRKEGYLAVLSGCTLGRFFGNYAIWNFSHKLTTRDPWKPQLGAPGSVGQSLLGKLFRSREHWKLVPDSQHTVLISGYDPRPLSRALKDSIKNVVLGVPPRIADPSAVAARALDGQTIIAYVPGGNATKITMAMDRIQDAASRAKCWWFNPRDGSSRQIGTFAASGEREFSAPDQKDWVLVIDSEGAQLPAPGNADLSAEARR